MVFPFLTLTSNISVYSSAQQAQNNAAQAAVHASIGYDQSKSIPSGGGHSNYNEHDDGADNHNYSNDFQPSQGEYTFAGY